MRRTHSLRSLVAVAIAVPGWAAAELTSAAIDRHVSDRLLEAKVSPAPIVGDAEFLRRLSLDVRGTIPEADEVIAFLSDKSPDKRAAAIDRMLADPLRGQHWANYWDKLLVGRYNERANDPVRDLRIKAPWKDWVATQFNVNTPLDRFAHAIVVAEGPTDLAPQTIPVARWDGSVPDVAGTMSRVFLGKQIQCAQCHDHPYDETLTQTKFWQTAAFFSRTDTRDMRSITGRQMGRQVLEKSTGETRVPDSEPEVTVQPMWPDGTAGPLGETTGRREAYAKFLTDHDREQFARNFVNRLWDRYFGRGIVEPVDDWQSTYVTPSHPALLDALTKEFVDSNFDVRHLERLLLNSETYQRSAAAHPDHVARPELFAATTLAPLTPEQLFASIDRALGLSDRMAQNKKSKVNANLLQRYLGQFVFLFGNDEMEVSDDFDANVSQALFFFNNAELQNAIVSSEEGATLDRILDTTQKPDEMIDYLYLTVMSRRPMPDERAGLHTFLSEAKGKKAQRAVLEDATWALLNSAEFRTNH